MRASYPTNDLCRATGLQVGTRPSSLAGGTTTTQQFLRFCQGPPSFLGGCNKTQVPLGQVLLGLQWKAVCNTCPKAAAGIAASNTRAKLAWGIANSGSLLEVRNLFLTF